jgi:hypothetical protein
MNNTEDNLKPSDGNNQMQITDLMLKLTKVKSAKRNGVAIDTQIALEDLRKDIDANIAGGPELIFEIETSLGVHRWRFRDGEGQLIATRH